MRRLTLIAVFVATVVLSAVAIVKEQPAPPSDQPPSTTIAIRMTAPEQPPGVDRELRTFFARERQARARKLYADEVTFLLALARSQETAEHADGGVDWFALATCETGANWQMTGSVYSTGLGIMNQAIRENSPPDVAARELNGTATISEQIETGRRIRARFGIHAWDCGKKLYP